MLDKIAVYVAGPIGSIPHRRRLNALAAIQLANELRDIDPKRIFPFVPHLMESWNQSFPRAYEDWMSYDEFWLDRCHVLFRIPGESPGADREVAHARRLGIPVVESVEAFKAWLEEQASGGSSKSS